MVSKSTKTRPALSLILVKFRVPVQVKIDKLQGLTITDAPSYDVSLLAGPYLGLIDYPAHQGANSHACSLKCSAHQSLHGRAQA
jgi:hypothetical protein